MRARLLLAVVSSLTRPLKVVSDTPVTGFAFPEFKGPADFCVMGETVYVPDLVASQLRIVELGR